MAKFWATISANIMKPGNAFANMAQGVSIAINDLDATRKEKDKLLMELEDTMAKSRVKLIESEGKSKIDYTKFTGKQRAEIKKLGKVGLDAFNAQLKVNGDYIAALAAAKKAENAAKKIAAKERKEGQLEAKDIGPARKTIDTVLTRVASGIFRKGIGISNKARNYKEDLRAQYIAKLSELGPVGATDWLTNRVKKDSPNYSKLVDKK
jgi:hypothetical protein